MTTAIDSDALAQTLLAKPGDHDKFSHYVSKGDIERALFEGLPAKALCGKYWVPRGDFKNLPVCGTCKDVYDTMKK